MPVTAGVMHKTMKVAQPKKPYMSLASAVCLVASLPAARLTAEWFGPKEDYTGFGALGIVIITIMVFLVVGLILGILSIWRSERPRALSISAISLNALAVIWLVVKILI